METSITNPLESGTPVRLHIGPSADVTYEYHEPLPFEDNSVDEILATHVLEHLPHRHLEYDRSPQITMLKDWYRILKPGGALTITSPDSVVLLTEVLRLNSLLLCEDTSVLASFESAVIELMTTFPSSGITSWSDLFQHRWWFLTANYLVAQLKALSFSSVEEVDSGVKTEFTVTAKKGW